MVCETIHEFYCSAPRTPRVTSKSGSSNRRYGPLPTNDSDHSLLPEEDTEGRLESSRLNRESVSHKLREVLKNNVFSLPECRAASEKGSRSRSKWTDESSQDFPFSSRSAPSSALRPMSQRSPRVDAPTSPKSYSSEASFGFSEDLVPVKRTAIRDNTERANEWIKECSPKVWLLDAEKEPWVQAKNTQRRRWKARTQELRSMQHRALPFDDWLCLALQAEQVADFFLDEEMAAEKEKERKRQDEAKRAKAEENQALKDAAASLGKERNTTEAEKVEESKGNDVQSVPQKEEPHKTELREVKEFLREKAEKEHREKCGTVDADWERWFEKVSHEYSSKKCELVKNAQGQIERHVNVAGLHVEARDGRFLVQLGIWKDGEVHPTCLLPSCKQAVGEGAEESINRLLKQEFVAFGHHVRLAGNTCRTHWRLSPTHGLRTKYTRCVMMGKLDVSPESIHFPKVPKKRKRSKDRDLGESAPSSPPKTWDRSLAASESDKRDEADSRAISQPEMYMLWHGLGEEIDICAWLTSEEFRILRSPVGQRQLLVWFSTVAVDPSVMPPKGWSASSKPA